MDVGVMDGRWWDEGVQMELDDGAANKRGSGGAG